jgi:biotin synthase
MSEANIYNLLASDDREILENLLTAADLCRRNSLGDQVYLRGLVEFSNNCHCNCYYCGIRRDNRKIKRYRLSREEIITAALTAFRAGFHSIALQAGETAEAADVNFIRETIKAIKEQSQALDPHEKGLGITLSIGELSYQQYQQLWEAGAHRYLLRMETTDPQLFQSLHPPSQTFARRLECLAALKDIGFQVGSGVMVGLPGQDLEYLAQDLRFFLKQDIDMLGMGPYIPHQNTPLVRAGKKCPFDPFAVTLKMLAIARLLMPDINIVASTALQSIHPQGLQLGLKAGANIVMPVLTPEAERRQYKLYENKETKKVPQLLQEIRDSGFEVGLWQWGDSPHYKKRQARI